MNGRARAVIDHVVVNTLRDIDGAAAIFRRLGFTLTLLGRHSLGSVNHLMMTPGAYLELIGVPTEGKQRQDVLDSPLGLNGLVFRSENIDETYARLIEAGMNPSPPTAFSRPVDLDGRVGGPVGEAKFRTVRVPNDIFPAGRVYFCEHLTPELVWRDAWMTHANGFRQIESIRIASIAPETDIRRYADITGWAAERTPAGWATTTADGVRIEVVSGAAPRFVALGLVFDSLDLIAAAALSGAPNLAWQPVENGTAVLIIRSLALCLECRSSP